MPAIPDNTMASSQLHLPPFSRATELIHTSASLAGVVVPNEPFIPASESAVDDFLRRELECAVLDELAPYFFIFCKRDHAHVDALHEYLSAGLHLFVAENPGFHLVRKYNVMFVKPIPHCLLNYDFWKSYLAPVQSDGRHIEGEKFQCDTLNASQTNSSIACRSALGLLRSYGHLIKHESDFNIAQERNFVPRHVTYTQFQHFIEPFRNLPDSFVSPRYQYGHIRMTRLKIAVRICRPKALGRILPWSYYKLTYHSGQYLAKFVPPLLFLFACLTLLLSSMQVGLAARPSEHEPRLFADVSLWFSVSIIVGIAVLGLFILGGFALYILNRVAVGLMRNRNWKKRHQELGDLEKGGLEASRNISEH